MILGKIGPSMEGLQVRGEEHRHGPTAPPGDHLHRLHVDAVQVGTFLAVDLDADEVFVHELGHVDVLEDLVFHHVTPVAG